jgi:arylsulfatase A-like enzyme
MAHNDFLVRLWHLPERFHPVNWAVREMCRTIRRRDRRKPGFWYLSFSAPHPPLVPLQEYLDLYRDIDINPPASGNWSADPEQLPYPLLVRNASVLTNALPHEKTLARRAFYASLTHIDHQIRLLVGFLHEEGLLRNTIVVFTSDHGHMIGEHGLWCMMPFFEMSAKIPLMIIPPTGDKRFSPGAVDGRLAEFGDIMPTLLDMCGLPIPETVDGMSLWSDASREHLYGEHFEGEMAMRMLRSGRFKLLYYATGNHFQLFDIETDPQETTDLAPDPAYAGEVARLNGLLIEHLYGDDLAWIKDGELVGLPEKPAPSKENRTFSNQRGLRFI